MEKDRPDIAFVPPLGWLLAVIVTIVLAYLAPLGLLPAPVWWPAFLPGAAILLFSLWVNITGFRTFLHEKTNLNPYKPALKVVKGGPYRLTRNPMYLGMVLFPVGLGLMMSTLWGLITGGVLWIALHYGAVLREESYLEAKFGEEYRELLASTRRWL